MRLVDLDPRWLTLRGERVGFVFRSPTDSRWYQSCVVRPTPMRDQFDAYEESLPPEIREWTQPCQQSARWVVTGESFDVMTVTPSIDGSAGGLWHGYITNGEIVGGI